MLDLTKTERRLRTLMLVDNLDDFVLERQRLMTHIHQKGGYHVFMKSRGYDAETWETIVKTLKAAGVLPA